MPIHSLRILICTLLFIAPAQAQVRVACIGDSITQGARLVERERNHYPAQLGWRLGSDYQVLNFGSGGRTLLRAADLPYVESEEWKRALEWAPQVAVVILGTNDSCQDSRRRNWEHAGELQQDARAMIASLREGDEGLRVLLCSPPPIFPDAPGLNETRRAELALRAPRLNEIAASLRELAAELEAVEFLDLRRVLNERQVVDGVHPTPFGAEAIADRIAEAILGSSAAPIDIARRLTDRALLRASSDYHGFERFDFRLAGDGPACTLVAPHVAASGRPWLWRMRFFGHQPALELELLDRGFHLAYVDVAQLYGSPAALERMQRFHALLTAIGLSPRPVLLGMSRGGLPLLAWTGAHPERTTALVGDNMVCDLRSWPGGNGSKRSDADWTGVLESYGWDEEQAAQNGDLQLRKIDAAAKAGVPLLLVQGLADTVVPAGANALRLARMWREAGGQVELWPKPGQDHHPHGLHPPAPLVRAILTACGLGQMPSTRPTPSAEYRGGAAGWGGGSWWDQLLLLRLCGEARPDARLVFLGDSITQGLTGSSARVATMEGRRAIDVAFGEYEALSLGLSGDRTEHILFRIEHGALRALDPELIVLQIGVNNLNAAGHSARETSAGIHAVVASLREHEPQAHVLICGPFPAGTEALDPRRATVNEIHARIAELDQLDSVTYLDLRPLFLSDEGRANEFLRADGIHITSAGQVLWMDAIRPLVERLLR